MPLYKTIEHADGSQIWIWRIVEETQWFEDFLNLSKEELTILSGVKTSRKKEWLASRYLIKRYVTKDFNGQLAKDVYGKPYLKQDENHISITHSYDFTALIYSPKIVGVDIQKKVDKISRIAHKFINETEENYIGDEVISYHHVIWGAKESIYKAYGRKRVDFKKHMTISKFVFSNHGFLTNGLFEKDIKNEFKIYVDIFEDYYLVYCIQRDID